MKPVYYLSIVGLAWLSYSCNTSTDNQDQTNNEQIKTLNPLEETKAIFQESLGKYDSLSVEDTDSTYTFFVIPKNEDYDHEKELYGAFSIEKKSLKQGDIDGDGLDDAVVQYSYTPHLDNNTLIYFKVLLQKDGKFVESGEIFGGGRCEGPIVSLKDIKRGIINFTGQEYASGDPCCCPSIKKDLSYKLENGKLIEQVIK